MKHFIYCVLWAWRFTSNVSLRFRLRVFRMAFRYARKGGDYAPLLTAMGVPE